MRASHSVQGLGRAGLLLLALAVASTPAVSEEAALAATPEALASAIGARRNVLLGEVHDNQQQHELRAAALRRLVEAGARPSIAFEQLDRDQQAELERLRRDKPGDVDALVALGARSWDWRLYRPYLQLAVDYGLPIVAANLSRSDAMKIATQGWGAMFSPADQIALGLDRLPPEFVAAHEQAVALGHCNLLPRGALPTMARAQIARDLTLARSLRPYLGVGIILLTGNGHVRKDIGVPYWMSAEERRELLSIGLLETAPDEAERTTDDWRQRYDAVIETAAADRPDPCEALRKRLQPATK